LAESPKTTAEGQQIHNSLYGSIDTAIASKPTQMMKMKMTCA